MATQWKLTLKQGQNATQVTQASGTTISGSNAIELNIDQDGMTQLELANLLEEMKVHILSNPYPAA